MNTRTVGVLILLLAAIALAGCESKSGQDWKPAAAAARGYVVLSFSGPVNPGPLPKFVQSVAAGEPASVKLVHYTVEGDPILLEAQYDGKEIRYAKDSSMDAFGAGKVVKQVCRGAEMRSGTDGTVYALTGCEGGDVELATLPKLDLPQRVETAAYAAELTLVPEEGTGAYKPVIRNLGDADLVCGVEYAIQKQEFGTWIGISPKENAAFPANQLTLKTGESYEMDSLGGTYDWPPAPGQYRVVKSIELGSTSLRLAAAFKVP
ncbi:DUF4362 domain-containing protein [Cohnella sp. 56]|uniref:DUF4362 domain-containing protein n=1 Tax=Cohnella sp. 56 TaxID=3113722 RepID=UPI0030E9BA19